MLNNKANSSDVDTTTHVQQLIMNLVDNAQASLDTLNEIAATLANDATICNNDWYALHNKADKSTTYTKPEATYL